MFPCNYSFRLSTHKQYIHICRPAAVGASAQVDRSSGQQFQRGEDLSTPFPLDVAFQAPDNELSQAK